MIYHISTEIEWETGLKKGIFNFIIQSNQKKTNPLSVSVWKHIIVFVLLMPEYFLRANISRILFSKFYTAGYSKSYSDHSCSIRW